MLKKLFTTLILGFIAWNALFGVPTALHAQTETNLAIAPDPEQAIFQGDGFACEFFDDKSSIMGCVAQFSYYIIYIPTNWIAALTGILLDFGLGFTLDSDSYQNSPDSFVTKGWQIVRDLSNIAFIFILLIIAISQILGIAGWGAKQMLAKVIIIALMINFSLFFSKIIIDATNLLGLAFYNSISVENNQNLSGYKDISSGIVTKFQPQTLISSTIFSSVSNAGLPGQSSGGNSDAVVNNTPEGSELAGYFTMVILIASGVNVVMIVTFFTVGILMIARVIGLWLAMIFSPLAFTSYAIPGGANWKQIGFNAWIKDLGRLAIMAPMFLFFLYLIISFVNADPIKSAFTANPQSGALLLKLMAILVPFILIIVLLRQATKLTKEFSGEIGAAMLKGVKTVGMLAAGVAGGAVLGGAAIVGRAAIGKAASNLGSGSFKNMANSKNRFTRGLGRRLQGVAENTSKASFDVRNTGLGKKLDGAISKNALGVGLNSGVTRFAGTGVKEGGYEGDQTRKKERREKEIERMMMSGDEATVHDANIKDRNKEYTDHEREFMEKFETKAATNAEFTRMSTSEQDRLREESRKTFETSYMRGEHLETLNSVDVAPDANGTLRAQLDTTDAVVDAGEVRTSGQINNDRRKEFAKELRQGTPFSVASMQNGFNQMMRRRTPEGTPADTNSAVSLGSIQAAQGLEKATQAVDKTIKRFDQTLEDLRRSLQEKEQKLGGIKLNDNPADLRMIDPKSPTLEDDITNRKAIDQNLFDSASDTIEILKARVSQPGGLTPVEQALLANELVKKRTAERNLNVLNSFISDTRKIKRDQRETEARKKETISKIGEKK